MTEEKLQRKIAALNQQLNARAKELLAGDPDAQKIIGEATAYQALLDEAEQRKQRAQERTQRTQENKRPRKNAPARRRRTAGETQPVPATEQPAG